MNILFLDAYHEPELIAYTHLEKDLIEGLIAAGHKVQVICPTPTRGINKEKREKYKKIKLERKYNGNVTISRFSAPKEGKNPVIRALRYLWCNLRTYQIAIKKRNVDLVFSNSTPPTQGALSGLVAKKISKKKGVKVPFIYNLQDIFPDSLVNSNLSHQNSLLWRLGRKVENFTYKHADKIIVISEGFKRNLIGKGIDEKKMAVISNWIDLDSVHLVERQDNKLISDFRIDPNKFIVVYAGNFGASQGADIVIKAAAALEKYENIQFVIFGGGAYYENAKKEAKDLKNVIIHDLMPQERVSEVYSLGDVALITCKARTGNAGMPSKIWSIMACNTPIIASFDIDSDLGDVIRDSGAGECVEPESVQALMKAIIKQYNESTKKDNYKNLRIYVQKHASKQQCVKKYIDCIVQVKNFFVKKLND